jgi:hypothetical protein
MKLDDGIVVFATEEARRKWEGKEQPRKTKRSVCPSCETIKSDSDKQDCIKENKE